MPTDLDAVSRRKRDEADRGQRGEAARLTARGLSSVDWFDLDHWQAILAAIVAIGTPFVAILGWFKPLLSWFGSRSN
jgi:hypothetical protein